MVPINDALLYLVNVVTSVLMRSLEYENVSWKCSDDAKTKDTILLLCAGYIDFNL